ncbi:hypothetical protein [Methylobacterium terricola]|uniref:hypothetical protein n=1 Tax=Methylobacterium terricola TaxID=2583531 RepID=UPI0014862C29|nr:hypothetical protein [Methylobacterium terricola]
MSYLDCDERIVRRWAAGDGAIPAELAAWLEKLAAVHEAAPPPTTWRRQRRPATAAEA